MTNINDILKERKSNYGEFEKHADLSQALKNATRLNAPDFAREGMEMIVHKIARIVNGDPLYADSWRDIEGYAKLVADILDDRNKGKESDDGAVVKCPYCGSHNVKPIYYGDKLCNDCDEIFS